MTAVPDNGNPFTAEHTHRDRVYIYYLFCPRVNNDNAAFYRVPDCFKTKKSVTGRFGFHFNYFLVGNAFHGGIIYLKGQVTRKNADKDNLDIIFK